MIAINQKELGDALRALRPDEKFVLRDLEIEWLNEKPSVPSEKELDAEILRHRALAKKMEYMSKRSYEYPRIQEQLDMLWHAMDDGALPKDNAFYTSIKAVKDKYPKPE